MTPRVEDVAWLAVEHESAVGGARRAATELASSLALPEGRVAEIGIAVSEIASNLVKHASGGVLLLRAVRDGTAALEVLAMDAGPGMGDVVLAMADGHSTAGTLGIGLGAIERLSTSWELHSLPGRGTVVVALFAAAGITATTVAAAGLTRPITGEHVCGDAYAVRQDGATITAMLADGLGHGPLAARASAAAVRAFEAAAPARATDLLHAVHRALQGTRGAAVSIVQLPGDGTAAFAGIGNVSGTITDGVIRRGMISHPGIAGGQARTIRETLYDLPDGALVVLHSDGVTERMALDGYAGLVHRMPLIVAGTILRDFGTRRDDASVVVLRPRAAA